MVVTGDRSPVRRVLTGLRRFSGWPARMRPRAIATNIVSVMLMRSCIFASPRMPGRFHRAALVAEVLPPVAGPRHYGVQLLAVECPYLARSGSSMRISVERAMAQFVDPRLIPVQPAPEAGMGPFTGHRLRVVERAESAQVS